MRSTVALRVGQSACVADDPEDAKSQVAALGVVEVGRRYVERLRSRLDRIEAEESRAFVDDDSESWIDDALNWGGELDAETRFTLVVAAAEATDDTDNEGALWCIGDMPADHLVGDSREMGVRLHKERQRSVRVNAMFTVMQSYLRDMGLGLGWWSDDWPDSVNP